MWIDSCRRAPVAKNLLQDAPAHEEMILDDSGGLSVITKVLIGEAGKSDH